MTFDQWGILILGPIPVFLAQSGRQRLAAWIGLCCQPFWFVAAIHAHQMGTFIVTCIYTVAWARGLRAPR